MKKLFGILAVLFLFAFNVCALPFTKLPKAVEDEKLEYSYGFIIDTGISGMNFIVFSPVSSLKCIRLEPVISKAYYDVIKELDFNTNYCVSITDRTLMKELNIDKFTGIEALGKDTLAVVWIKYSDSYCTALMVYKRKIIEWLIYTNDKAAFQVFVYRGAKTIKQ